MRRFIALCLGVLAAALLVTSCGGGQSVKSEQAEKAVAKQEPVVPKFTGRDVFPQLSWLLGCWKSEANGKAYYEHWLPERDGLIFGTSYSVADRKSVDHQLARLELIGNDLELVVAQSGKMEQHFWYVAPKEPKPQDGVVPDIAEFSFENAEVDAFPKWVSYRREGEEWGVLTVVGAINGATRELMYSLRRVSCATRDVAPEPKAQPEAKATPEAKAKPKAKAKPSAEKK